MDITIQGFKKTHKLIGEYRFRNLLTISILYHSFLLQSIRYKNFDYPILNDYVSRLGFYVFMSFSHHNYDHRSCYMCRCIRTPFFFPIFSLLLKKRDLKGNDWDCNVDVTSDICFLVSNLGYYVDVYIQSFTYNLRDIKNINIYYYQFTSRC